MTAADLRRALAALPPGDEAAADAVAARQDTLTKPPGSLGRLETLVAWLARWQGRPVPRLDRSTSSSSPATTAWSRTASPPTRPL